MYWIKTDGLYHTVVKTIIVINGSRITKLTNMELKAVRYLHFVIPVFY